MSDTYSTHGPQCPYCEYQYTADEPHYYSDSFTEEDCASCGKTFSVEVDHITTWSCETIDEETDA